MLFHEAASHALSATPVIVSHEDRRIPLCEPDAVLVVLVILVIFGALLLVFYLA